jgi:phasin family protein
LTRRPRERIVLPQGTFGEAAVANPPPGAEWFADFTKAFGDMRSPMVDIESLVAMQRKNVEALTEVNQVAMEGVQAVLRHQMEMTRRTMEEFSQMFSSLFQANGSVEDRFAKHAEFSKAALETGISNARELGDLVAKANSETINVLSRRIAETLEELRDLGKKR